MLSVLLLKCKVRQLLRKIKHRDRNPKSKQTRLLLHIEDDTANNGTLLETLVCPEKMMSEDEIGK